MTISVVEEHSFSDRATALHYASSCLGYGKTRLLREKPIAKETYHTTNNRVLGDTTWIAYELDDVNDIPFRIGLRKDFFRYSNGKKEVVFYVYLEFIDDEESEIIYL